jgi:glycosyltransferase involved in cell wall biosynthesis
MRLLTWHWGRRGAGPRFAALLHAALGRLSEIEPLLSLSAEAEILRTADAPDCDWPYSTYPNAAKALVRLATAPFAGGEVRKMLHGLAPDFALCAMPSVLDRIMIANLDVPYGVIVHDALAHPGESVIYQIANQKRLLRQAKLLITLSQAVTEELYEARTPQPWQQVVTLHHPPMPVGGRDMPPEPFSHGGLPRLLMFGRLMPYKGLDLLLEAMERLGSEPGFTLKIAGDGPSSAELRRLSMMRHVEIDRRWIPEGELPALIGGADVVVLPYRQASQSGVAAAALALRRHVIATRVGGLAEQLRGAPRTLICQPEAQALAGAIRRLCSTPSEPAPIYSDNVMDSWVDMAVQLRDAVVAA